VMLKDKRIRKFELVTNYRVKICKNGTVIYRCNTCNKFYSNKTKVISHNNNSRYACPHCESPMESPW
jgi:predicted SprT family Zn-dependent metalloprotease